MRTAVIVSSVRTAVGKCRGSLAPVGADILGGAVIAEAVKRARIDPTEIEDVIFGNLLASEFANIARTAALEGGLPIAVPALTVDRQCASSLQALINAAAMIQAGFADIILAGGVESDSRRPYVVEKPTMAYQLTAPRVWDTWFRTAPESIGTPPMIITAENVAKQYKITREQADEFAVWSHHKAATAWDKDRFAGQIVPITVKDKKSETVFDRDESIRPDISVEALAKLKPVMVADGIVTAGNSSPMNDGASAMIVMEKGLAKAKGLEVLAEFKAFGVAGVDPNIMGIGPVYSTKKLMGKTGLKIDDFDLIELNEAFAVQSLACINELGIDRDKLNVNGGAIALGHPLAGTGGILVAKMVYEMKRRDVHLGLISFCCGGGQGVSVVLERH